MFFIFILFFFFNIFDNLGVKLRSLGCPAPASAGRAPLPSPEASELEFSSLTFSNHHHLLLLSHLLCSPPSSPSAPLVLPAPGFLKAYREILPSASLFQVAAFLAAPLLISSRASLVLFLLHQVEESAKPPFCFGFALRPFRLSCSHCCHWRCCWCSLPRIIFIIAMVIYHWTYSDFPQLGGKICCLTVAYPPSGYAWPTLGFRILRGIAWGNRALPRRRLRQHDQRIPERNGHLIGKRNYIYIYTHIYTHTYIYIYIYTPICSMYRIFTNICPRNHPVM